MKKIIVSLVICAMLCAFLPFSVFAGYDAIKEVRLTVNAPVIGGKQNLNVTVTTTPTGSTNADKNDYVFQWYIVDPANPDPENWSYMYESTEFEDGKTYGCALFLSAKSGYGFSSSTVATVNGSAAYGGIDVVSTNSAVIRYVWGPLGKKVIDKVSVTIDAPAAGKTQDRTAVITTTPSGGVDTAEDSVFLQWYYYEPKMPKEEDWVYLYESTKFESGKGYACMLLIQSADGYVFSENIEATVNGKRAYGQVYQNPIGITVRYVWQPLGTTSSGTDLDSVAVTLNQTPAIGKKVARMEVDVSSSPKGGVSMMDAGYGWLENDEYDPDIKNWDYMDGDTFEEGKYYAFYLICYAWDDYNITPRTTYTINGQPATGVYMDYRTAYCYRIYKPGDGRLPVESISATGVVPPSIGANPSDEWKLSSVPFNDCLDDVMLFWFECDTNDPDPDNWTHIYSNTTFKEGKYYAVEISSGIHWAFEYDYKMSPTTRVSVNGKNCNIIAQDDGYIVARYVWGKLEREEPKTTPVKTVSLTVDPPAIGKHPDFEVDLTSSPVDGVTLFDAMIEWFENDTNDPVLDNWTYMGKKDTFKAGKYYAFRFNGGVTEGYRVTSTTAYTINGKTASTKFTNQNHSGCWYVWQPMKNTVGSIAVTGVTAPVVGESPNRTFSLTAAPTKECLDDTMLMWYECGTNNPDPAAWTPVYENYKFKEGKYYAVEFAAGIVWAYENEYRMSPSTTVTINGNKGKVTEQSDGSIVARYVWGPLVDPKPKTTPVKTITVTGITPPVVGKKPSMSYTVTTDPAGAISKDDCVFQWYVCDTNDPDFGNWSYMYESSVFEEGKYYTVGLSSLVGGSYNMTSSTIATVNGEVCESPYATDKTAVVRYVWGPLADPKPKTTPVKTITVTGITPPAVGKNPSMSYTVTTDPAGAISKDDCVFQWYVCDTNDPIFENWSYMYESSVFEEGKYYAVGLSSLVGSEYNMASSTIATVNGEVCESPYATDKTAVVRFAWGPLKAPTKVRSINVKYTAPKAGEKCDDHIVITADPAPAIGEELPELKISWYKYSASDDSWIEMKSGEVFEKDGKYALRHDIDFESMAADGYEIAESTAITFNDDELPEGGVFTLTEEVPDESSEVTSEEASEELSEETSEEVSVETSEEISEEPSSEASEPASVPEKGDTSSVSSETEEKGGIGAYVPYIITFAAAALVGGLGTALVVKSRKKK